MASGSPRTRHSSSTARARRVPAPTTSRALVWTALRGLSFSLSSPAARATAAGRDQPLSVDAERDPGGREDTRSGPPGQQVGHESPSRDPRCLAPFHDSSIVRSPACPTSKPAGWRGRATASLHRLAAYVGSLTPRIDGHHLVREPPRMIFCHRHGEAGLPTTDAEQADSRSWLSAARTGAMCRSDRKTVHRARDALPARPDPSHAGMPTGRPGPYMSIVLHRHWPGDIFSDRDRAGVPRRRRPSPGGHPAVGRLVHPPDRRHATG